MVQPQNVWYQLYFLKSKAGVSPLLFPTELNICTCAWCQEKKKGEREIERGEIDEQRGERMQWAKNEVKWIKGNMKMKKETKKLRKEKQIQIKGKKGRKER